MTAVLIAAHAQRTLGLSPLVSVAPIPIAAAALESAYVGQAWIGLAILAPMALLALRRAVGGAAYWQRLRR